MALEEARASSSPPADLGEGSSGIGSGVSSGIGSGVSAGIGSGVPYHERQRRQLCALHALNSLLQQPWLSQRDADGICRRPLGLGNYDVNVVMAALRQRGLAALWWDRRRSLDLLSLPHILGFLLNVPSQVRILGSLPLPLRRPHWFSVRRLGGIFYNLDSKLPRAEPIGPEGSLRPFLAAALSQAPSQLFLVVTEDVEETGAWLRARGTPGDSRDTPE